MSKSCVFVNMTHPSQLRDDSFKRKIKAYTSKHNMKQKSLRDKISEKYLSPPPSDEEDNAIDSGKTLIPYARAYSRS